MKLHNVTYQYAGPDGESARRSGRSASGASARKLTTIVGGAGSGKSTFIKLLLGRLVPQDGAVQYGDATLATLQKRELAAMCTLMPQTLALLDGSIAQNILFGRPRGQDTLDAQDFDVVESPDLGGFVV